MQVHRRLLLDDGLGVGESLDERGVDHDGIVYSGTCVCVCVCGGGGGGVAWVYV